MRFIIDEDLPRSVDKLLQKHGHEPVDIRDTGLRGASDSDIAAYSQQNKACLVTCDVGFANIRNYPPEKYFGIIVLRLPAKATAPIIMNLLEDLLKQSDIIDQISGKLAIVESGRVRIRKS